jgi:hypothetical protein
MAQINAPDTNTIGNVLAGIAVAFLVDNVALAGAVTKTLPSEIVAFVGFIVFAGVGVYVYKQAKKLN